MQDEINKIEIVLENCEVITVDGKYIGDFSCEGIEHSISRVACNSIKESYTCKDFSMSIHRDCSLNDIEEWTLGVSDIKRDPLKRINNYNDITSIYIYFTKDKENPKQIYVKWGGDSDYNNEYQKSYINKFGDLFIVVSEDLKLGDVFDMREIEDKNSINWIWRMYS